MPITIDSHQVFPELETNKIDDTICKSDNPKTGLFLLENKHLIDKEYLSQNTNDWAVNFLINNPEYKYEFVNQTNDFFPLFKIIYVTNRIPSINS